VTDASAYPVAPCDVCGGVVSSMEQWQRVVESTVRGHRRCIEGEPSATAVLAQVREHLDRAFNEGRNWCPTANDEQAHDIEMMAAVCLGYLDQLENAQ
jgi:hypothetical protein